MPHYSIKKSLGPHHGEIRKIAKDWTASFKEETIVALYHHCRGTKGLAYIREYEIYPCDLCGTDPTDEIRMMVKMYNVRL